jgi:hypothetical protein
VRQIVKDSEFHVKQFGFHCKIYGNSLKLDLSEHAVESTVAAKK